MRDDGGDTTHVATTVSTTYHTIPYYTTPYHTIPLHTAPYPMIAWWLNPFVLSATPPPPAAPHILHTVCHVIIFNAVIGKYLALLSY